MDAMDTTQEEQPSHHHFESRTCTFIEASKHSCSKNHKLLNHHRASCTENNNVDIATELSACDTITNNDVYNFKEITRKGPIGIIDEDEVMQDDFEIDQQYQQPTSFSSSKNALQTHRPRVSSESRTRSILSPDKYYEIKCNIEQELLFKSSQFGKTNNSILSEQPPPLRNQNNFETKKEELHSKLKSARSDFESFLKSVEKEIQQERIQLAQSKPTQPSTTTTSDINVSPIKPTLPNMGEPKPSTQLSQTTLNIQPTLNITQQPTSFDNTVVKTGISQPILQPSTGVQSVTMVQPSIQPTEPMTQHSIAQPSLHPIAQPTVQPSKPPISQPIVQPVVTPSNPPPQIVRVQSSSAVPIYQIKVDVPQQGTRTRAYMRAKFFMNKLEEFNAVAKQFENDKSCKSSRTEIKKKINGPFNRAADDESSIRRVTNELYTAFETFQKSQGPIPNGEFYYSLVLYANTLIENACSQATDLKKVFPYAKITSQLMVIMPEVLYAVIGTIHSKCVFTIPYYPLAKSKDEFKTLYGFEEDEDESAFVRRMKEIIILFASIIQTDEQGHEYGVDKGWEWLAAVLNLQPIKYTIEMVDTFVKIAGHRLEQTYNVQFAKLLRYLEVHFIPNLPPNSDRGSITRLNHLIGNYKKDHTIPPPIQ